MDLFDGCELWNSEKFWQNQLPLFSPCLRNSFLRWIPVLFLVIGFLFQIHRFIKQYAYEKVNLIYKIKVLIVILFGIGSAIELVYFNGFDKNTLFILKNISSAVELVSYLMVGLLFIRPRNKLRTDCLLLLYSFVLLVCSFCRFFSSLVEYNNLIIEEEVETIHKSYLIYLIIHFILVLSFFVFNCCKDSRLPTDKINCPIYYAPFLSRASFWWIDSTIRRSFRNPIKEDELWNLHYSNRSSYAFEQFNRFYKEEIKKKSDLNGELNGKNDILISANLDKDDLIKNGLKNGCRNGFKNSSTNGKSKTEDNTKREDYSYLLNKPPQLSLTGPLFKAFWVEFLVVALFRLIALSIQFLNPLILDLLLTYIKSDGPIFEGVIYGLAMFWATLFNSLFNNQYEFRINIIGMKIRAALTMAIYKKILALSSYGRSCYATGEIVNLMGADCERIFEFIVMVNQIWACGLQILICLFLIYNKIGLGFLGALLVIFFIIPWNTFVTRRIKRYQAIEMKYKDDRVNFLSEILNGAKVLKLYGWDHYFKNYLLKIRNKEFSYLKKKILMQIFMTQSYTVVPFSIVFFCLFFYVIIYPDEILDANKTFVIVSLVNIIKSPLSSFPNIVSNGVMSKIAITRINKFLSEDELNKDNIQRINDPKAKEAIVIKNSDFIWNAKTDTKPVLKDVQLKIKKNQLIAVVGSVASGKSSLLAALLGEMHKIKGSVCVNGSVAYVSQQAWILNQSLRKNILFANEYDKKKYQNVLARCQLIHDLKLLAAGDETEIGEKGINLSGGQKQRVNIARAVYSNKDIYLFDDPLSALDSNVGKELFDQVIGPNGLLKNKTRILVTHKISLLPQVDKIVVLKNGTISEIGSYSELMNAKGDFADFISQHTDGEEMETNLGCQEVSQNTKSRSSSLQNSFRSSKSACLNCKNSQSCIKCNRQRTNSVSSRKSCKSNSARSVSKTFDEFDLEIDLNNDEDKVSFEEEEIKEPEKSKERNSKLTETEKIKAGGIAIKTYKEYLKQFNTFAFIMVVVFYFTAYGFNYWSSIWLSEWTDDSKDVELAKDPSNRNWRVLGYCLLGIAESTFVLFSIITLSRGCLRAGKNIHDKMLHNISCCPSSFFDSTPLGRILNRFSKDLDFLNSLVWMNFRSFLNSFLKTTVSLLIISTKTPSIMLFILPLLSFYFIFQIVYVRTKRQLVRINLASKSPIYSTYQETINGAVSIRAFGLEKDFENSCHDKVDQNSISHLPSVAVARWLTMRLEFLGNVIVLICIVYMVINRDAINSPALVGLTITSAMTINATINNMIRRLSDLENNVVSIERCIEYTELEKEDNVPDERSNLGNWPTRGNIKFKNYSTKYRPHLDLVLNDISFEISSREKIGVVGRTGAGKSSLTLALFRIIEAYSGSIEIDDRNIADLGLYELRSRQTIIPQEPILFTGNLRLNLDPLSVDKKGHTDSELWLALEQAHLKEFVQSCPGGLDFAIQEGGENLSVGQRQLVCLARALLRKSKVLILDEATATVDIATDELIQKTIKEQFSDCTIITIAHRLNTIMDYDRILVLENGRVKEFDTVTNLLANKDSIFYSMAKSSGLVA